MLASISPWPTKPAAWCSRLPSPLRCPLRRQRTSSFQARSSSTSVQVPSTLPGVTKELDELLSHALEQRDVEDRATALATAAQQQGILLAFGRGQQVPKRIYTIDELRLNKVEPEKLLSPQDNSLNFVRNVSQAAALAGLGVYAWANDFEGGKILALVVSVLFTAVADQVANQGGGEALLTDALGRVLVPSYSRRVALHEAGHFLVAYLLGVLPKAYTLSSWDAFSRYRALNIQAGTQFCDRSFEGEVASGRLSSTSLDHYSCVALAGVVTEYLRFGQAEGGLGDVAQLDRLLQALQFTQKKADAQVRWAVLNVAALLRRHAQLQDQLAAAMAAGDSVGTCIRLIEQQLAQQVDLLAPSAAEAVAQGTFSTTEES